jgi:hypothetical protein
VKQSGMRGVRKTMSGTRMRSLLWATPLCLTLGCYGGADDAVEEVDEPEEPAATPELQGPGSCNETIDVFRKEVWAPFMSTQCFGCHSPGGAARHTKFVLQAHDVPGYMEANLATVANIARLEIEGESLLLLKPTGQVEHGGGTQLTVDDERYEALRDLIPHLEKPVHCADETDVKAFFAGVEELDRVDTLRRATFALAGRYPTPDEEEAVDQGGGEAFDEVLRAVMEEPTFYERLVEMYNDQLLTDAYLPGRRALDFIDPGDFPGVSWWESLPTEDPNGGTGNPRTTARNRSNQAIAREPLQIVRYVAENHRPFSEIVTADYTMVNPFSARVYGVDLAEFVDPEDPNEWIPTRLGEIPHSGVLTTPAFLNRYPTTDTNRNRERAQITYLYFLATDLMQLGSRPIDTDSITGHNPTMYNPACTSCHDLMDPIAGAFQNWDDTGRFRPEPWYQDMLPPGFSGMDMPADAYPASMQWLGQQIADDPRFARAVVQTIYTGLTGERALQAPTDPAAANYAAQLRAFEIQDFIFKKISAAFIQSGYDLRTVVTELVRTPYFRAINVEPLDEQRKLELANVGAVRLVTPEQLHRRIAAATGYAWRNLLPRGRPYNMMYGGIDSDVVTERLTAVNGVMTNVAERMANEMACLATAQDFTKPAEDRTLFPAVEVEHLPGLDDEAIRANIVYLHDRLLLERLDANDPEVERTYQLFVSVLEDGQSGLDEGWYDSTLLSNCQASNAELDVQIVEDPDYTVRAWMAVVAAMLGDFRFLYE